jgi:hypothetical protein
MGHDKSGDGKGETAKDMKLTMVDFTDPAAPSQTAPMGTTIGSSKTATPSFAKNKKGGMRPESEAKPQQTIFRDFKHLAS